MATRKQLKRRRKVRVHGVPEREERAPQRTAPKADRKAPRAPVNPRTGKPLPAPSLKRSARKGALLFALMIVTFVLFAKRSSNPAEYLFLVLVPVVYIPVDYRISQWSYGKLSRRLERERTGS